MLTYKELSAWWHVPLGTLQSWVARGTLPHVRLADRSVRFEREVLNAWLTKRRSVPSTNSKQPASSARASYPNGIRELKSSPVGAARWTEVCEATKSRGSNQMNK